MNSEHVSHQVRGKEPGATAQVISLGELHGEPADRSAGAPILAGINPLYAVRTRLAACVGTVDISVGDLIGAREHQVLVLDRGLSDPVDLLLEGKVVARGQLVAVDGCFAVRITELPVALGT